MASPQRRQADLGVLLVHGMGEQRRGDTLTEAGDALISWLQRWCERPPQRSDLNLKGDVTVLESSLRIADADELEAPHLTIRLRLPVRTGNPPVEQLVTKHWLVAEAWWSETFRPASFNQLVGWVLGIGPWVLATQFHGLRDRIRIPRAGPRVLTWLLWPTAILTLATLVAATAVLSLLLTILAALVLVLRLVPIGPVQSLAEGIQRSLASSFGDLMVLVQSPSRFGAMRSQVRADLKALANQCDKVVVVAHSQGSHIAWETLRRPADDEFVVPEKTVRLITYGQAMRKLRLAYRVLRRELDSGIGLVGVAALVAQFALGLLLAAGASLLVDGGSALRATTEWFTRPTGLDVRTLLGLLVALVVAGNALLLYRSRAEANDDANSLGEDVERATEGRDDFRWVDIWSSADPAPNGPLAAGGADAVSSWRVRNAGSVILDHSIYWQNLTEFVGAVGTELGRFGAGTPHFPNDRDPFPDWRLRLASLTRGARIHVLSALRAMWLAAVLAIGATLYPPLQAALNEWLPAEIPLIDFLREWLPGILALGILGAGGLVGWVAIGKVWGAGVRADDRAYFAGRIEGPFPWPSWFGLLLLAVVPGAAFVGLWRATGGLMLPAAYALAAAFVALAAFTFISGGGRGFAEEPAGERVRLSGPLWLTAAVFSGLFLVVNAGWFRPEDDVLTTALAFGVAYAALAIPMAAATVIRLRTFLAQHTSLRSSPP